MITIAIYCHNYQHRLCWMLSSLRQQVAPPAITVDVASMADAGEPRTELVVALFRAPGVRIRHRIYEDRDAFQFRGNVRTDQLNECDTEWLLFADCDMVYHPAFFHDLAEVLRYECPGFRGMLTAGRYSQPNTTIGTTADMVALYQYPCVVPAAWEQVETLEKVQRSNVGAGFFQLINVENCPHGGYYVQTPRDKAWAQGTYWKTRSDAAFRRRIGNRRKLPQWFSEHQIHVNHDRDNMHGCHIEAQR